MRCTKRAGRALATAAGQAWLTVRNGLPAAHGALPRPAPGGVRVADVMTPHPVAGASWMSVSEFTDHVIMTAFGSAQTVFPVTGPGGRLAGVVTLRMLTRMPACDRAATPLRQVMLTVPEEYLAAPGDLAAPLLTRSPLAGEISAFVITGGKVAGIVITGVLCERIRGAGLAGRQAATKHLESRRARESAS